MKETSNEKTCPRCGMTIGAFRKTGLIGCAECYTVFRAEIMPTVRFVQGKTRHAGKVPPAQAGEKYSLMLERALLKDGIERAIKEGRYADAEKMQTRLKEANRILRGEETQ